MKLGISSYCFNNSLQSKEMDIFQVLEWAKEHGAEHVEIVPIGLDVDTRPELADTISDKARELGLEISNYSVSGNVLTDTIESYEEEITRLKQQVEIAARLGCKKMRHDIVTWGFKETEIGQFEADLPRFADACGRIADYAATFGITTSVEDHGFYITPSDRLLRLVKAVNRDNFKITLDIGNFMCVGEDPGIAVKKLLPYASIVHFKDFLIRKASNPPGAGWLETLSGKYIRGTIFGQGDMDVHNISRLIKESGYDGYVSLEFEGLESDQTGTRIGLENIQKIWNA